MSETIAALTAAVEAAPSNIVPRLMLADAHREAGDDRTARITEITARLTIEANVTAGEIWTLERAKSEKGHAARTAEQILSGGKVLVVIYTDDSLTESGLLKAKTKMSTDVVHYRKSSGGRWGRSKSATNVRI